MSTARSLNKALLIGNLTRNPVLRSTSNGATVCTFGVATNATWKDGTGNLQERTEFHNVVAWNKLAEICAQILSTGMLVYIEGELRTRTWDDANGVRHYRTEVKIDDMKLLDDKGKKGIGIEVAKESGEAENDSGKEDKEDNKDNEDNEDNKAVATDSEEKETPEVEKTEKAETKAEQIDAEGDDLF